MTILSCGQRNVSHSKRCKHHCASQTSTFANASGSLHDNHLRLLGSFHSRTLFKSQEGGAQHTSSGCTNTTKEILPMTSSMHDAEMFSNMREYCQHFHCSESTVTVVPNKIHSRHLLIGNNDSSYVDWKNQPDIVYFRL